MGWLNPALLSLQNAAPKAVKGANYLANNPTAKRGTLQTLQLSNRATSAALAQKRKASQAAAAEQGKRDRFMAERQRLSGQLQAEQDAANRANELRYGSALAASAKMGHQARQDIQMNADRHLSQSLQSMMSRGMNNSTVLGAMERRAQEETNRGFARVAEGQAGQRIGIYQSRTDLGPNPASYMGPMQTLGYAGNMQGTQPYNQVSSVTANTARRLGGQRPAGPQMEVGKRFLKTNQ